MDPIVFDAAGVRYLRMAGVFKSLTAATNEMALKEFQFRLQLFNLDTLLLAGHRCLGQHTPCMH